MKKSGNNYEDFVKNVTLLRSALLSLSRCLSTGADDHDLFDQYQESELKRLSSELETAYHSMRNWKFHGLIEQTFDFYKKLY